MGKGQTRNRIKQKDQTHIPKDSPKEVKNLLKILIEKIK